jgi:hypothetical protein
VKTGLPQPAKRRVDEMHLANRSQLPQAKSLIVRHADDSTEGADPRCLGRRDLEGAGFSPVPLLKVIREKCRDCCAGSTAEVAKCTATGCPLWPYRMGTNPFSTRTGHPESLSKKSPLEARNFGGVRPSNGDGGSL